MTLFYIDQLEKSLIWEVLKSIGYFATIAKDKLKELNFNISIRSMESLKAFHNSKYTKEVQGP